MPQVKRVSEAPADVDDTSSIYSRSPGTPKSASPSLPSKHSLPEINALDHQIALVRGSTITLEMTRTRLQCAKANERLSPSEKWKEKLRQWECQETENQFYQTCLEIFKELSIRALDACQDLELQRDFMPEISPIGNAHMLEVAQTFRSLIEMSRVGETQAEQKWKRQWNSERAAARPSTRWI